MTFDDIKLFPHNQDTYNKIQEQWKMSNKVATVQATGTGKTYLILKCLYNIPNENKLVLAPSNYILEQTQNEAGEAIPNTILMTYADLAVNTEDKIQNINPSLIVFDEFHRCGAEQWGNGVQKLLDKFPNAKILGTSATNIRFLDNNRDMAEELFDGNIVNNLSLPQAIVKKILPMPKYISALYTFENEVSNLKDKVNNSKNTDEEKEELLKEIDLMKNKLDKSKGIPQIFKKYLDKNSDDKFIVFCKNIEHLNEMKEVVTDWFKKSKVTKKIHVYSAYTGCENTDKEIENFSYDNTNTVKLLFSIDMFNEGIHIKDVSGVILLRPTISPIIYYQQIGRAIQVGKKGNPLIFDFVNNFDNIGAKNFIDDLREQINKKNNDSENNYNDKKDIDSLEFLIFDEMQEAKDLFENIEDKLIDNWEAMYAELIKYKNKFGNCNVPQSNIVLGKWISNQRHLFNNGKMALERIQKLKNIGFDFSNLQSEYWKHMYELLLKYKYMYKDCNVPNKFRLNDESLGVWVCSQRKHYKDNTLSLDKVQKLNEINFIWNPLDNIWNNFYNDLIQFKNEYGNYNVPRNYKKNKELSFWIKNQKNLYQNGTLDKIRENKLKNIGFTFDNSFDNKWNIMYFELQKYINQFGTKPFNSEYKRLSEWVTKQRKYYKENKLSKERIEFLNKIGFMWTLRENKSGVKGVYLDKNSNKWVANIYINGKQKNLGQRKFKLEAIKLRKDAEIKYFGKSDINLDDFKEEEQDI